MNSSRMPGVNSGIGSFKSYLSLIKFSHTIFAMPFALIGFFLGLNNIRWMATSVVPGWHTNIYPEEYNIPLSVIAFSVAINEFEVADGKTIHPQKNFPVDSLYGCYMLKVGMFGISEIM